MHGARVQVVMVIVVVVAVVVVVVVVVVFLVAVVVVVVLVVELLIVVLPYTSPGRMLGVAVARVSLLRVVLAAVEDEENERGRERGGQHLLLPSSDTMQEL